jgi:hypothetical protein
MPLPTYHQPLRCDSGVDDTTKKNPGNVSARSRLCAVCGQLWLLQDVSHSATLYAALPACCALRRTYVASIRIMRMMRLALLPLLLAAAALPRSADALPPWSWDTMQVYIHCANMSGPWAPWAAAQLAKASFVVLEKPHGLFAAPVNTSAETKIAAGCAQIKTAAKAAGKETDCYIYTEVDWARTYYTLGHTVDSELPALGMHYENGSAFGNVNTLTCPNKLPGPDGVDTFHYSFHAYDFRKPRMQQLWAKRITDAVATGHVDGSFIDGNRGGWGFGNTKACQGDAECVADLKAGLEAAHKLVASTVGPTATLISNYPTPEALQVANGGMCERCGHDASTVLQLQETYFGRNGTKRCGLHNQPCVLQYRCYGAR